MDKTVEKLVDRFNKFLNDLPPELDKAIDALELVANGVEIDFVKNDTPEAEQRDTDYIIARVRQQQPKKKTAFPGIYRDDDLPLIHAPWEVYVTMTEAAFTHTCASLSGMEVDATLPAEDLKGAPSLVRFVRGELVVYLDHAQLTKDGTMPVHIARLASVIVQEFRQFYSHNEVGTYDHTMVGSVAAYINHCVNSYRGG